MQEDRAWQTQGVAVDCAMALIATITVLDAKTPVWRRISCLLVAPYTAFYGTFYGWALWKTRNCTPNGPDQLVVYPALGLTLAYRPAQWRVQNLSTDTTEAYKSHIKEPRWMSVYSKQEFEFPSND